MKAASSWYSPFLRFTQFLFGFALLYKISDTLVPRAHSDPLYYTLHAPKIFHYYGWDVMIHDLVPSLMTGILELFTLLYFQFTENLGLIHILAQLLVLGSSLILGAFLIRRWTVDPFVGFLAGFSILTFSRDSATFIYAKGDGVVGVVAMIATYAVYSSTNPWLTGLLIGLLPAIKLSGLYPALVIGLVTVIKNRKNPRYFLTAGLVAAAVVSPFLIRNYIAIGNPLFPGYLKAMPGKASRTMVEYYSMYYNVPPNFEFFKNALSDLLQGKIIFGLWIYFLWRKIRTKDFDRISIVACALGTFAVYCLTNGVYQGTRYFFSVFFMLGLFAFLELDKLFRSERPHFLKSTIGMAFLLALALSDASLEMAPRIIFGNLKEIATLSMPEIVERATLRERDLWASIPKHPNGNRRILSEVTSEGYYLDPLYRLENRELSMDGGFLKYCDQAGDLERLNVFDYFILSPSGMNPCHEKIRREGRLLGRFAQNQSEVYERTWSSAP